MLFLHVSLSEFFMDNKKSNYIMSVKEMISKLLELVNDSCHNKISSNLLYITTEINLSIQTSFKEEKQYYKKENLKKNPISFDEAIKVIDKLYLDLYDVNLFLYKSCKRYAIIEIRYLLKSSFDKEYYNKIKDYDPMLHAKIAGPSYIDVGSKEKYDINWQHSLIKHPLKMFLWRLKYRMGI